jgi:NAD(P)-dependent dehydrogenase (short-subunit alcohol dehydrogenase family)
MGLLDGKVAIVTGAAHGIGRGHALELAKHGAKVVVNDLGCTVRGDGASEQDADAVVQLIKERGGEALSNYGDVADFAAAGQMIQQAVDTFGKLDILVNNAGIIRDAMVFNMSEDDFDSVIRVHLKGTFCPTHHAAKYWREENKAGRPVSGRIINTTSGAGLEGNVGQANYASAKAGIAAMTITTSLELARYGVTVNCIAPAGTTRIAGTMGRAELQAKEPDDYTEYSPLDPSNGSPLVAWLASDEAAHVSGQVLRAVGESIIRMTPWDYGRQIEKPGERWTAEELGFKLNAHVFGVRNPGLRSL